MNGLRNWSLGFLGTAIAITVLLPVARPADRAICP